MLSREKVRMADGDLRIFHRAGSKYVGAVLGLLLTQLGRSHTRILRLAAPDTGLGLSQMITQLAGHAPLPSRTGVPPEGIPELSDDDVERAHHLLTELNDEGDGVLLLIEGAQNLQPTALRYIQHSCRTAPRLHLAYVGSEALKPLLERPEFAALASRPVTELHLDERAASAEACLALALSSASNAVGGSDAVQSSPMPAVPALAAPLPDSSGWRGANRLGWLSLGVLGLVAVVGTGAWVAQSLRGNTDSGAATRLEAGPLPQVGPLPEAGLLTGPVPMPVPVEPPVAAHVATDDRATPGVATTGVTTTGLTAAGPAPTAPAEIQPETTIDSRAAMPTAEAVPEPTPETVASAASIGAISSHAPEPEVASDDPNLRRDAAPPGRPNGSVPAIALAEIARADNLLATGDISGARRWYEYAAAKGSAIAATSLGKTYDPNIPARSQRMGGVAADPEKAGFWYQKGAAMGDANAAALLANLHAGH